MLNMIYPIIIVVAANTFYNIGTKSIPQKINSFAALSITYIVAAVLCVIMFFLTSEQKNFINELTKANWTSFVLGFAVVALEFGYVCIYRSGWKVSAASIVANIILAIILLFVGWLLYKESISIKQIAGVVVCTVGLILMK